MRVFWILVILLILFADLICYAACVVAGRADKIGAYKEWEISEADYERVTSW